MSFGHIIGQIMQDGMGRNTQSRNRLDNSARALDRDGGGMDDIFSRLQGALGGQGRTGTGDARGGAGGMAEMAKQFLGREQAGGMTGAQIGGIGAAAGAMLGGGLGGAARGGLLAVLGTMALGALKGRGQRGAAADAAIPVDQDEIDTLTSPEAERLMLRAMISAAKADGEIDESEMDRIVGKLDDDSVTKEERRFAMSEMRTPLDVNALAAEARNPAQAAEVYAASLLAIDADSEAEQQYLRELASALRLDADTVTRLHEMTGAPTT